MAAQQASVGAAALRSPPSHHIAGAAGPSHGMPTGPTDLQPRPAGPPAPTHRTSSPGPPAHRRRPTAAGPPPPGRHPSAGPRRAPLKVCVPAAARGTRRLSHSSVTVPMMPLGRNITIKT